MRSSLLKRLVPAQTENGAIDWDAVYAEQLLRVLNFFRYQTGDEALAEDLTAITFEKAWRNRERYRRDVAGFSTWLFSIARNVVVDHFRKHREHVPLDAIAEQAGDAMVEEKIERRQDLATLNALLAELPKRERELIALKYGAGLTNRAIAGLLRLSESNVGTILERVTRRLRECWEPQ
jgi:RNA polymerase sigma-70 factor (ECF subfamily)